VIKRGNILKDVHKRYIMYQLLKATKYMHSGNVIHRDHKVSWHPAVMPPWLGNTIHLFGCSCYQGNKTLHRQTYLSFTYQTV